MLHTYILHTVKGFIKTLFNEYAMCFDRTHPLHFLPTLLLFLASSPNRVTSIPTFYIHSGYYVSVENVRSTNERKHEVFLNLARTWEGCSLVVYCVPVTLLMPGSRHPSTNSPPSKA